MTARSLIARVFQQEDLNFLLTNRIPRRLATRFVGWFSKIEQPLVRNASIGIWRLFSDLDLSEAKHTCFKSMHDCFTRELKEGARPVDHDPAVLVSPCDGIVGACGPVKGTELIQAKGFPYNLQDLLCDADLAQTYRDGHYVTLRLTSSMYHRFHAPHDCRVERMAYVSGDTWNVNPIALKRVEKLFCKNERAVLQTRLSATGHPITLVPVAAILVASIRLHFLDTVAHASIHDMAIKTRQFGCVLLNPPYGDLVTDKAGLSNKEVGSGRLRLGEGILQRTTRGLPSMESWC
ncbi:MAG: phosphatidylserine decarboxylase [Sphingomonadales bacterium]|nr:phosphatidylserine decarboxylase [Sphingomonadales bacterium]